MSLPLEMKGGANASVCKRVGEVAGAFEDEQMMPVAGVRISLGQRVIDEHRHTESCPECERDIEGRIFVGANGGSGRVQDELTCCIGCRCSCADLDALGEVRREQVVRIDHVV